MNKRLRLIPQLQCWRVHSRVLVLTLLAMMLLATLALGCGWSFFSEHSVRFNFHSDAREFYRLPPLPDLLDPKTGQWKLLYDDLPWVSDEARQAEEANQAQQLDAAWQQAETDEQHGSLVKTQASLRSFLAAATKQSAINEQRQYRINSAQDRLDALSSLKQRARDSDVREYLARRRAFDKATDETLRSALAPHPPLTSSLSFFAPTHILAPIKTAPDKPLSEIQGTLPTKVTEATYSDTLETVLAAKAPRSLQDNYAYLKAALLYRLERFEEAKTAFQDVARKYPGSERHEAALYMATVAAMKHHNQNVGPGCGEGIGNTEADRTARRTDCQNRTWQVALLAMNQLLHTYPHGKFTYATYENRAYWLRRGGELALGAADYYRMLGHPSDVRVRLKGKEALRLLGQDFGTDAILNQLEAELANDPQAALAYAYHRIYNHAVDYSYAVPYHYRSDNYDEQQKENESVRQSLEKGQHELQRITVFATAMMRRYPNAGINGAFVLRVAQAQIELQNFREALPLASKASHLTNGDGRAEALWIRGSAEHKLKNHPAARATFTQLVREFPQSHLTEGARRLLAMVAEDAGDLDGALEQYLALKYQYDVAYFLDVLLTPEQLASFIARHPQMEERDVFVYSLGLRYLRNGQWKQAQAQFTKLSTVNCKIGDSWWPSSRKTSNPKWSELPAENKGKVCAEWVLSDLKTTNDLSRLEQQIADAQGDEAKAEAMYQFASYQFENSQLLFYNPAIWGGARYSLLCDFDEVGNYRVPNEAKILYEYMQSHENLSHAIPTYLELARLYPNTRAAKDGLYTAVVAHRRLSNYNNYWRRLYQNGLQAGERLVTFREIRSLYPKYQLPRAEHGWEPMTRTVNGGPG